jgi:hypothetical protein
LKNAENRCIFLRLKELEAIYAARATYAVSMTAFRAMFFLSRTHVKTSFDLQIPEPRLKVE